MEIDLKRFSAGINTSINDDSIASNPIRIENETDSQIQFIAKGHRKIVPRDCKLLSVTYIMGSGRDLTNDEKKNIIKLSRQGTSVAEIARITKRCKATVYKVLKDPYRVRTRAVKAPFKSLSNYQLKCLKRAASRNPLGTSREIFGDAGIPNVPKTTRNRLLNEIARVCTAPKRPRLTQRHRKNRMEWAKTYMKTNFEHVIFTDECRATLDGPDGWSRGWLREGVPLPTRVRRQQGGGGVMFWAGIVGERLVGPFKVPEGVKITSDSYIAFLTKHFMPWYKSQSLAFKRKAILMHDGAPSHSAKKTTAFLTKNGFKEERIMDWPSCSPDLNPIENLWAIMKRRIYAHGRQFNSKSDLWEAILDVSKSITSEEIKNLVSSVDTRLINLFKRSGKHVGY